MVPMVQPEKSFFIAQVCSFYTELEEDERAFYFEHEGKIIEYDFEAFGDRFRYHYSDAAHLEIAQSAEEELKALVIANFKDKNAINWFLTLWEYEVIPAGLTQTIEYRLIGQLDITKLPSALLAEA